VKAARHVDALTSKLFANTLSAVDTTFDQVLYEVGSIQRWGWCESNDWRFYASHQGLLDVRKT
jgi:hypothetical protein